MLTWSREGKNTRGIAEIRGGINDKKIVYINPDLKNPNMTLMENYAEETGDYDIPIDQFDYVVRKKLSKFGDKVSRMKQIQTERKTEQEFKNVIGFGDRFTLNDLEDSHFSVLPNVHRNDIISVFGRAGSGKSFWENEFGLNYKQIFPNNPIFMISRFAKDDSIDDKKLGLERIILDKNFITYPMDYNDLKGSLVMIDDIDGLNNLFIQYGKKGKEAGKLLEDKVLGIQNDIIRLGREHVKGEEYGGIYAVNIRHKLYDRSKTDILMNGSSAIVIFPRGLKPYHVDKFIKEYVGADKELTSKLKDCERWFMYHQNVPRFVMTDKFIQML